MKNTILLLVVFIAANSFAQEHFGGTSTSRRVGIINSYNNPSELANLSSKFEIQLMATSFNLANNKIGFKDITAGKDLKDLIFKGNEAVNLDINSEIAGPAMAIKLLGFAFAISTKANMKASFVNVDPVLGDALSNGGLYAVAGISSVTNKGNQKITGIVWGEMGLSVAKRLFKNDKHQLNAGATLKLLFPGTYGNIGLGNFNGTISNFGGNMTLSNATGSMNIAYSGGLANDFTNPNDFTKSIFGPISGMCGDIGVDYQYKPDGKNFKLKIGAALKNVGSMTFKAANNYSRDYNINPSVNLNLNQFANSNSIIDIENTLLANNFIIRQDSQKDFKVKLPTVVNLYADLKIISKLSATVFMTQKMGKSDENDQIFVQNSITVTPRVNLSIFEAYIPITKSEIAGTTAGIGFRLGGFFIGSNSAITAITNNSKQADFYTGFRFGFL